MMTTIAIVAGSICLSGCVMMALVLRFLRKP
jgi:hypothetical protein